jgi:hypothetical protein
MLNQVVLNISLWLGSMPSLSLRRMAEPAARLWSVLKSVTRPRTGLGI